MGKKSGPSVPDYAKTTYGTGDIFGSSTTDKNGTNFNSNTSMSNIGNNSLTGWNNALTAIGSNDYSNDPNFQVYLDNFNKNATKSYQTNVLNPIQSQGLTRSSALQAATNAFNDTLTDNLADLYDSYYNRQVNNLGQYQNSASTLYDMIMGINRGSQKNSESVNSFNQWKYQQELAKAAQQNAGVGNIASGAINGAMAGSSFGPWGALAGAVIGGAGGAMK